MRSRKQNLGLALIELIPAVVSIPVGIVLGQYVCTKSGSVVLGVIVGLITIPLAFVVIAYTLMFAIGLPLSLLGKTSSRDEFFDDRS
tara:strand:- start:511 stop:771 length:261 start_codon:yes stop_codon:yes gene_type:complete